MIFRGFINHQKIAVKSKRFGLIFVFLPTKPIESLMKRLFQKVWIAILAVITVIVGSCCSHKNTTSKADLQRELDSVNKIIRQRENSTIYGSPEVMERYGEETRRLHLKADSLQNEIDKLNQ